MGRAIKKPIPVEFIQLKSDNIMDVYVFLYGKRPIDLRSSDKVYNMWWKYEAAIKQQGFLPIKTLESGEGVQNAGIGDYILKGIEGECWPVKPEIFEKTYDVI